MKNEAFKKFQAKLRWEGFLRSLLCGLAIGFAVLFVSATICWVVGFKGIWLSIVLFAVAVGVATTLFYFLMFSPDTKKMAKRIDELGLEERIITMTELEGDDSFIAVKQREDAMAALGKVNASAMKLVISVPIIIACAVIGVGAVGMTTVHALNVADVVPSGIELIQGEKVDQFYSISYSVDGSGLIYGVPNGNKNFIGADKDSIKCSVDVKAGEKSDAVIAVAKEGYVFVGWSDGYNSPFRASATINENKIITALFQPVPDVEEKEDEKDDIGKAEALKGISEEKIIALKLAVGIDVNSTKALASGSGSIGSVSNGRSGFNPFDSGYYPGHNGGGNSSGDGSGENGGGSSEVPQPGGSNGSDDGPGGWQDNSASKQVINGHTYYGDVFEDAYNEAMSYLNSGEDIPDYLKKIIKDYFDTIAV